MRGAADWRAGACSVEPGRRWPDFQTGRLPPRHWRQDQEHSREHPLLDRTADLQHGQGWIEADGAFEAIPWLVAGYHGPAERLAITHGPVSA